MGYCYLLQFVLKAKKRCNRINQNLLKGGSFMKERSSVKCTLGRT